MQVILHRRDPSQRCLLNSNDYPPQAFYEFRKKNLEGNLEDNPVKNKESKIALLLRKFQDMNRIPNQLKYLSKQKPHPDLGKKCLEFYKG